MIRTSKEIGAVCFAEQRSSEVLVVFIGSDTESSSGNVRLGLH